MKDMGKNWSWEEIIWEKCIINQIHLLLLVYIIIHNTIAMKL